MKNIINNRVRLKNRILFLRKLTISKYCPPLFHFFHIERANSLIHLIYTKLKKSTRTDKKTDTYKTKINKF